MQHSPKITCNFLEKVLAKNTPDEGISITLTYYSDYTKSTDPESTDPEGECEWDSDGEYFDDGSGYYVVSVE